MMKPRWSPAPADNTELYGRLLSAAEAERVLGISASTVRTWHARNATTGLYSAGLDSSGRPLFYEADLIAMKRKKQLRDKRGERLNTLDDLQ
jgi:transposase